MTLKTIKNLIALAKAQGITAFKYKTPDVEFEWVFGAAEMNALEELREEQRARENLTPEQRAQEERAYMFPPETMSLV